MPSRCNPSWRVERTSLVWAAADETLLAALADGDADAAVAFVRRFQQRVYGLAHLILGGDRAAEDVAQEAFLRAWRLAGAYDPRRGTVATWLMTITCNLAIDARRLRRADPVDPDDLLVAGLVAPGPGPEEAAAALVDTSHLRAALAELPAEQRRALVHAVYYGRTAREVGEVEGIPLGTAKTRIRTALLRLRAALLDEVPHR